MKYCRFAVFVLGFASVFPVAALSGQTLEQFKADVETAITFVRAEKFGEAKPITEKLLALAKKEFAEKAEAAALLRELGKTFREESRFINALECLQAAEKMNERLFGEDSEQLAADLNELGEFYHQLGNYSESENFYKSALRIREKKSGDGIETAQTLNGLSKLLKDRDRLAQALAIGQRALEIREEQLGKDHPDTAESLSDLAVIYQQQTKYADAMQLLKRALEIDETRLGKDHPAVATVLNNIGVLHYLQGRPKEAEDVYCRALEIREKKPGKNHPDTAESLSNLGELYRAVGRFADAASLLERAVEIYKLKRIGHPDTAAILNNLALTYAAQNRLLEAEPLLRQAFRISEDKLGPDHALTMQIRSNLAIVFGHFDDAESFYCQAIVDNEKKFGNEHPKTASAMNALASYYVEQARYDDAEPLYLRALAIRKKNLGSNHPDTAQSWNNIANFYRIQACFDEAKRYFDELDRYSGEHEADDPEVLKYLHNIAIGKKTEGDYRSAESRLRKAIELAERFYGKDHPNTAVALNSLAELYHTQRRYSDAEKIYRQALEICLSKIDQHFPYMEMELATAQNNLASLYADQKRYAEAEPLYQAAKEIYESKRGRNHPDTAVILNDLGELYREQGRFDEAEPLFRRALRIRERISGKNHPDTATILCNMASLYYATGHDAKAEELFDRSIEIFEKTPTAANDLYARYYNRAVLHWNVGRSDRALADLSEAMRLVGEIRKNLSGSGFQRSQTFEKYYHIFETMVDWQHELADRGDKSHNIAEAYKAMELSRARGLWDLIDANVSVKNLFDKMEAARIKQLQEIRKNAWMVVKSAEKKYTAVLLEGKAAKKDKEKAETAFLEAKARLFDIEATIENESPLYRDLGKGDKQALLPFEAIRQRLDDEKCLALEYLIGEDKSFLLAYGAGLEPMLLPLQFDETQADLFGVSIGPLTAEKLDNSIFRNENKTGILEVVSDKLRKPSGNGLDKETAEKLAALWSIIVPNATLRGKLLAGNGPLLILPDGVLSKLPFEILIVNADPEKPVFLLDKGPATLYAPSMTVYHQLSERKPETFASAVLTVGDPLYQETVVSSNGKSVQTKPRILNGSQLDRLARSANETFKVERHCQAEGIPVLRLDKETSTEKNVRDGVVGCRIVHLSCHGLVDNEYGNLLGCLALTVGNADDTTDDGILTLGEIMELDLKSCELTVLGACHTNMGPNQRGEGTWSIGRSVLVAGSRRIVTTDWAVLDDIGNEYVSQLIKKSCTEKTVDYAHELRAMKLLIKADTPYSHPFYWAPFILVGAN